MSKRARRVGERGQVTIPKELRKRFGIEGGDEVIVHEQDGKIVLETPVDREKMIEGYRRRREQDEAIAEEMAETSREANDYLGDVPEW